MRQGGTLQEMPLRVAYYARVSSDTDGQANSLSNQQSYFEDFISKMPNWNLVGRYVDEGLSGITVAKRVQFNAMIADAEAGLFDFIITKEISRFARNTLDSIHFTRTLLQSGVAVWFQQDNINTIEADSELRLSIMASLAQEESRRMSNRIKFGHEQAIRNGTVMGNSLMYGYSKENGKLVIDECEAEMVKIVFDLYATGEYSTPMLEKILYEKGYRNSKGSKINRNVLRKMITNPKYKGYYCGNKVKVVDLFTKKQKFLHETEWEMYRDHEKVPPIVDEMTWDLANKIFAERSNKFKADGRSGFNGNLFTGKLFCAEHGVSYHLKRKTLHGKHDETYMCSHRINHGASSCRSLTIRDSQLRPIVLEVLQTFSSNIGSLTDKYIECLRQESSAEIIKEEIIATHKSIEFLKGRRDRLIDRNIKGYLTNEEFKEGNIGLSVQIEGKKRNLKELEQRQREEDNKCSDVIKLKKQLISAFDSNSSTLSNSTLNLFIDKIEVAQCEGNEIELNFILGPGAEIKRTIVWRKSPRSKVGCSQS